MGKSLALLLMAALLCLISCKSKLGINGFIEEIANDGSFNQRAENGEFFALCSYLPSELMAITELRGTILNGGSIGQQKWEQAKSLFIGSRYFSFTIGLNDSTDILRKGVDDINGYNQRINELTFNVGKYFYALTGENDTIRASIVDFQRSYGMSPNAVFLVAFNGDEIINNGQQDVHIIYEDQFFGVPRPFTFTFKTKELEKKLPAIKLDQP